MGDVNELLRRDMGGKAVLARPRPGHNGRPDYMAGVPHHARGTWAWTLRPKPHMPQFDDAPDSQRIQQD